MILPYYLRLLCLCLATFFVVQALACLLVRLLTPAALRLAGAMKPRMASRWLFALRTAPAAVALFLVLGFCVPSYVWLEPDIAVERVGWFCLAAAALAAMSWILSLFRSSTAVVRTELYLRRCHLLRPILDSLPDAEPLLVVEDRSATMAVAGVLQPKLVVSRAVRDALSREQWEAALRHEAAHQASRDNLKKLLLLLLPDVVPFLRGSPRLEQGWARFTEWAADDAAVDGSRERAFSLASALVRVAKLGMQPVPGYVLLSLIESDRELATRVDRLLREPAYAERPLRPVVGFVRNTALVIGSLAITVFLWPQSLGSIHQLLERLVK